jgi:hypothetical protein
VEHADRKPLDSICEVLGAPHVPGRDPWIGKKIIQ